MNLYLGITNIASFQERERDLTITDEKLYVEAISCFYLHSYVQKNRNDNWHQYDY